MRIIYLTIIILIGIIFISCDDSFSPKSTYDERYSLNCIIRGDTSFHVATTYKSYNVHGIDPYENRKDSFVDGALIRVWRGNDEVYVFRDSTTKRVDTSRYNTDIKYYYIKNFIPNGGDSLDIEVLFPDGVRLYSNTKVPKVVLRNSDESDIEITRLLKGYLKTTWKIKNPNLVYLPNLVIDYLKNENGVDVRHKKSIPWKKLLTNNSIKLIYPTPSKDPFINYETDIIEEAMKDISKNDSDKSKYTIISLLLELSIFDENLSTYYFTVGYNDNSLAVGLDEGDYSNIENGFGIFGSFYSQSFKINVSKTYANGFGYNFFE